ncbi:MAG TPA: recombinase family protein [Myxococcota bacterium]|nr:recombinase family protein [Myxococcota bacterium]
MPRLALYARVSTAEQHVEPQLHALRAYAEARGLTIAAEYIDHGVSGAKDRRPALDRLLADARGRRFDVVARPYRGMRATVTQSDEEQ